MDGVLVGGGLEIMLKESISRFLEEFQNQKCDFSGFRSIFFRLLQSAPDPPLEVIWFYSAVSFHEARAFEQNGLSGRVAVARDLFQLLSACSAACRGVESVALLAPVIYALHKLVSELSVGNLSAKKGKKLWGEIECLVEGVVGYISICSCEDVGGVDKSTSQLSYLSDLVRVWTAGEEGEGFMMFFPLVGDRIRGMLREDGCRVDYLAAAVMLEAFLLKLYLKLRSGCSRTELKTWAVGAVTAFHNHIFFDMLLRVLSELSLQTIMPLSSADDSLLEEILFDTLILVDYSFLGTPPGRSDSFMKSLALTKLMAVLEAVQFARSKGDLSRAISYISAFSRSRHPSDIIRCITDQTGMEKSSLPILNTPQALLKWLITLEDKGLISLDISELRAKFSRNALEIDYEREICNVGSIKDDSDLFFIDSKGEDNLNEALSGNEEMQSMDSVFLAAAQTMRLDMDEERQKRKLGKKKEKKQVKFLKYEVDDDHMLNSFASINGYDVDSGSEVENPVSDDNMEEITY